MWTKMRLKQEAETYHGDLKGPPEKVDFILQQPASFLLSFLVFIRKYFKLSKSKVSNMTNKC